MGGIVETDKAFGVPGRGENLQAVLDGDGLVGGRVHDEQRSVQGRNGVLHVRALQVVEELLLELESRATDRDARLALDLGHRLGVGQQAGEMAGFKRRRDRHHADNGWQMMGGLQCG